MKYAKIDGRENNFKTGVLYSTYSSLIGESHSRGKFGSRFKQIVDWLGPNFDGLIVFDECHRAKNFNTTGAGNPTKTGLTVLNLQNALPLARIVYASATGASEPKHMGYMVRLGLWGLGTPFADSKEFVQAVEKRWVMLLRSVSLDSLLCWTAGTKQHFFKLSLINSTVS
jgi:hypothetical protein